MCDKYSQKEVELLEKRIADLEKRCKDLEKIVTACTNSFIPSSKRIIKETVSDEPKEPKKKGAPIGHPGTTRETSEPDSEKIINPTSCPICNGVKLRILKPRKKTVEDIEMIKHTTAYTYFDCQCEECKARFTTTHSEMPIEGKFGPNISALWTLLHYKGTIPFDRLCSISASGFKMPVSVGGIQNVIYRNAKTFKPEFNKIWKNVSESKYAKSDETGYSFNGERYWVWNISAGNDTLVLMRKSRGSKVLKEVFGEFFDGVLLSDCFSAYGKFNAKEYAKCWAHILVAGRDLAKYSSEGKELYEILCRMYE
ncbi:MAG: transposase, partial [Nanoarchaeota archaeon]|nr:transposase [Nanoarchaeota archaeon]